VMHEPIVSTPGRSRSRGGPSGPSRAYLAAVGVIGAIIVLLVVLILTQGSGSTGGHSARTAKTTSTHAPPAKTRGAGAGTVSPAAAFVSLSLRPTALVYVCLVGEGHRALIPGLELAAGKSTATYRSRYFEITLGNSDVSMVIDGIPRTVKPSSQAIGFSITKAHGRRALPAGRLPTCG